MKPSKQTLVLGALGVAAAIAAGVAINVRASNADDRVPPAAHPALTVSVERPQPAELPLRFGAHGSVAAWQEAIVGAEIGGLRIAQVHVNVGDRVRRGQVLASFAADTTQADLAQIRAALAEAQAHAAEASANAQRARTLAPTGALSEQQIAQYLTAEQTAHARVEAQRAAAHVQSLRLAQTQVLAPDDGVISARIATVGAVAAPGQELFRLIRGGRLEWRAEVTAAELAKLQPGTPVQLAAADGRPIEGRVRMVAPTVDAHTRLGLVYVDLPAAPALKAGMFAHGDFVLGRSTALTVPQQALVVRDGFSYVFRLADDHRVVQTRVTPGRRAGGRVEVVDGLAPGTPVVAGGAGFLNDGDLVQVAKASQSALLAQAATR